MLRRLLPILLGVGVFVVDQIAKFAAFHSPESRYYLVKPWLGWEFFPNPGIAFSLPIPNLLVLAATPLILFLTGWWWLRQPDKKNWLAAALVLAGALSNFFDRFRVGVTIDYLRLFYSVINLADVAIVLGILWILFKRPSSRVG